MHKFYLFRSCVLLMLLSIGSLAFAQQAVTGKVTSAEDGAGLAGVNITEKGTTNGTVTDADGNFNVSVNAGATLVFSFIGFATQEVVVGTQSNINVSLATDAKALQEVVVVGYGTQRKADVTGSIVQVKGEEISKQSSINPISALQGKVAGVQITNSGAPGSSPQITIRGVGTVKGNTSPLYVVDGVWYDDISFLNPNDIENINVLKDASSQAIYGVRAANGAVIITTKRGTKKAGTVITYNGFVGNQVATNMVKMASGPEFAQMINELDQINGVTPRYANPSSFGTTDWYHQILRNALISNHSIGITGGGEKSSYNFSLGYLSQDGTVKTNSFDRYTVRFQNDFQPLEFLKLGYTVTGAMNSSRDIDNAIFTQMYAAAPNVPVYYADGTYGDPNDFKAGGSNLYNPQVTIDFYNQKSRNYRMTGNFFAEVNIAKHFTFRTSLGGDFGQNELRNYSPAYVATLAQRNSTSLLTLKRTENRNWIFENTASYENDFNGHGVKVLVGQTAQSYKNYVITATARNVPNGSEGDYYANLGDPATRSITDEGSYSTVLSYFGRINYSFNEKYLLNGSFRADGSSKFTGDQRWGYFPAIGVGWVITEEDFMKSQSFFSSLKLRGSWGKIGNVSVPNQLSVLKVDQTPDLVYVGGNGSIAPGASVRSVVPPFTYWERGVGTDIGLEASFFNGKLSAEFDFYNKKTEKAIFDVPIPYSLGTTGNTIIGNQATYENQGFEAMLRWRDNLTSDLSYTVSANMGYNENKVLEVSTGANPIYASAGVTGGAFNTRTVVGQPIGQFYGLQVVGIFQNTTDVSNYQSGTGQVLQPSAKPGDFKYADTNGDGVIDDKDRVVLGNPNPKFTYGINTNWIYKAFDLTVDFQGVGGVQVYNANLGMRFGTENFSKDFYDHRWHGDGTSTSYPSPNIGGGQNYVSNSFYVESGSYFRIRNLQLGYTLPREMTSKWKISKLRVYGNAQNAFNFFSYRGFNPEVGGDVTKRGIDINVYPLYATYNFGVNVTF